MSSFLPLSGRFIAATYNAISEFDHIVIAVVLQVKSKRTSACLVFLSASSLFLLHPRIKEGGVMLGD